MRRRGGENARLVCAQGKHLYTRRMRTGGGGLAGWVRETGGLGAERAMPTPGNHAAVTYSNAIPVVGVRVRAHSVQV